MYVVVSAHQLSTCIKAVSEHITKCHSDFAAVIDAHLEQILKQPTVVAGEISAFTTASNKLLKEKITEMMHARESILSFNFDYYRSEDHINDMRQNAQSDIEGAHSVVYKKIVNTAADALLALPATAQKVDGMDHFLTIKTVGVLP